LVFLRLSEFIAINNRRIAGGGGGGRGRGGGGGRGGFGNKGKFDQGPPARVIPLGKMHDSLSKHSLNFSLSHRIF
jgi:hypothetical protein